MFYTSRVLFIHAPRCGGSWLTDYARNAFSASCDSHYLKHATRDRIIAAIPETESLISFAIQRDRRESEESWFNMIACQADDGLQTSQWKQYRDAVQKLDLNVFREGELNPFAKEFAHGCHVVFKYENPLITVIDWLRSVHEN